MVVMMRERSVLGSEAAPFTVMVMMEGCTIALTILAKTALTGIALSQNLAFLGLSYSSPIVVCATGLLIPSISFLLSILLRTTKLEWSSISSQAKVIGTLISITGAIIVELYKGPFIRKSSFFYANYHYQLKAVPKLFVFYSPPDSWILGGILLAAASLSVSTWNVIQLGTFKLYPQVMKVASSYSIAGTIQCLVFALFVERDLNAWKLKHKLELLLVVLTGVFGSIIRSNVHLACTRMKGPFYVPMFKPFGILFATVFGVTFFTNSLHYGSVIGTIIIGMGYYTVLWGQIKEKEELRKGLDVETMDDIISDQKIPLLSEREKAQV